MSEESEWEPITALIPSALSFSAFSELRTRAVILKAGKSGCSKKRERTEPPTYPISQVVSDSDNSNVYFIPVTPVIKMLVFIDIVL